MLGIDALAKLRIGDDAGSEASFRAALDQAARAHDDAETVRLWGALIYMVGAVEGHPDKALAMVDAAKLALVRAGSPPELEARLETNVGAVKRSAGDAAGARASLEHALALGEEVHGKDAPENATTMSNYANALQTSGAYREALGIHERLVAMQTRLHGAEHPTTAQARELAALLASTGDHVRAASETRAAIAVLEPALGAQHKSVLTLWNNLGVALGNQGKTADATAAFEHVIAVSTAPPMIAADALNGLAKLSLKTDPAHAAELLMKSRSARRARAWSCRRRSRWSTSARGAIHDCRQPAGFRRRSACS